jgi:hypothetical protein
LRSIVGRLAGLDFGWRRAIDGAGRFEIERMLVCVPASPRR